MSYPPQMTAMAKRLANFNSTIRKFEPKNKTSGWGPNDNLTTVMPEKALLDLRTLKMHAKLTTSSTNDSDGYVAAPPPIGLIDQITTLANNKEVEKTISGFGRYCLLRDNYEAGAELRAARKLLNGECLPHLNQTTGDFYTFHAGVGTDATGDTWSVVTPLYNGFRQVSQDIVIDAWPHCFLGTSSPCVISSSIAGDIELQFRLAPADVLTSVAVAGHARTNVTTYGNDAMPAPESFELNNTYSAAGADAVATPTSPVNPTYRLDDVYFTCKTLVLDEAFYSWLRGQITDSSPYEIPFTRVWAEEGNLTQGGSLNQSTKMSVQSSSVDMLLLTFQPGDYNSGQLQPGQNSIYATAKGRPVGFQAGTYGNLQLPRYFHHGCIDGSVPFESRVSIGGVPINEPADLPMIWEEVKDEFNVGRSVGTGLNPRLTRIADFRKAFFVHPIRLNWKSTDSGTDGVSYLSGLNTRDDNIRIIWRTAGATEDNAAGATVNVNPVIYASTTAVAQQMPNQRMIVRP